MVNFRGSQRKTALNGHEGSLFGYMLIDPSLDLFFRESVKLRARGEFKAWALALDSLGLQPSLHLKVTL